MWWLGQAATLCALPFEDCDCSVNGTRKIVCDLAAAFSKPDASGVRQLFCQYYNWPPSCAELARYERRVGVRCIDDGQGSGASIEDASRVTTINHFLIV